MPDHIGIAFLGSGFAQTIQAPAFAATGGATLVGASSPNSSAAFAEAFKMPVHTADWKSLVRRDDVHLVCVSSPPVFHYEQASFALACGKHVLCEKPFTMNLAEAERLALQAQALLDASKQASVMTHIDHELRLCPERLAARDLIRNGKLGRLYFVSAVAQMSSRRDATRSFNWWSDKAFGGGIWGALGSHLIDQLRFLTGEEITETHALLHTAVAERPTREGNRAAVTSDDSALAAVRFQSGITGHIFASVVSTESALDIVLTGEKGSLKIDMNNRLRFQEEGGSWTDISVSLTPEEIELNARAERLHLKGTSPFPKGFVCFADAIIKTLQAGEITVKNAATFEDGVRVQRVLDAAAWASAS